MQIFSRKPPAPADAVPDAPLALPPEWLAAVAGGMRLNPQPLPPFA